MLNKPSLLILGAGGYGLAVAEAAELSGQWQEIMFADDRWPATQHVAEYNIVTNIANLNQLQNTQLQAIVAVGNNTLRQQWQQTLRALGIELTSVIHPKTVVSPTADIGLGVTIMAGSVVGVDVKVGDGVIINLLCAIDHDAKVGDFSHLRVGVLVAGGVVIEPLTFLAAGTVLA